MTNDSLSDRAYQELRAAIIGGRILPGEAVLEVEVGAMLRMSRTPVREALLHLELEGYLVRDQASRLVVHRLSAREVAETFVVRELLEGEAARLAASCISDEELARLGELVAADRRALRRRRFDELAALNEQIHGLIMIASRNRTLTDLLRHLRGRIAGLDAFAVGSLDDQQQFVEEHAMLLELLRDGDADAVVALLSDHLGRARDVLLGGLEEGEPR
ncbi:MAG TPA: GntR family transcriptional regulator [Baekduia sp.]|uniref:GntR family transcriptional regulator n=1 Tax=Baekduia sp. TaxID=2600305 RepID=UPI002B679A8E|nr:GntR family transcriptional regulator [Baekduia sp.]HMJ35604.1 GntR family transcriptional regulator [Baekduia sp.]